MAYCHCIDCRRWTGAPLPAFAAIQHQSIQFSHTVEWRSHVKGVERVNCPDCGSPMAARFDYLPDQIYLPVGVLDQAALYPSQSHCHTDARLSWLHINDELPTSAASGRARLLSSEPVDGT
ncbi:GFA family protein [Pelagimonas varians]|nr:GFA family protein [Pelagimonas varians]